MLGCNREASRKVGIGAADTLSDPIKCGIFKTSITTSTRGFDDGLRVTTQGVSVTLPHLAGTARSNPEMSTDSSADGAARVAASDSHEDVAVVKTIEEASEVDTVVVSDVTVKTEAKAEGRTCALCAAKKPIAGGACGSIGRRWGSRQPC